MDKSLIKRTICRLAIFAAMTAVTCSPSHAVSVAPGDTLYLEVPFRDAKYISGKLTISNPDVLADVSISITGAYTGETGRDYLSVSYDKETDGTILITAHSRADATGGETCNLSFSGFGKAEAFDPYRIEKTVTIEIPNAVQEPPEQTLTEKPPAQQEKPAQPAKPVPKEPDPIETTEPEEPTISAIEETKDDEPALQGAENDRETIEPQQTEPEPLSEAASEDASDGVMVEVKHGFGVGILIGVGAAALSSGAVAGGILGAKRRKSEREIDYTPLVEYDISEDA